MKATKLKDFIENITVEPATFIFIVASFLQGPAEMGFMYKRICMARFGTDDVCDNLNNVTFKEEEDMVQSDTSRWNMYINIVSTIPPLLMIFVYGAIADKYSRKLCMIIPLCGATLESVGLILMTCIPSLPISFIFVGRLLGGFSGASSTYFMAILSYISVITTEDKRTTRLAIAESMFSLGVLLSFYVGGLILDSTSYLFVFSTSLTLQALAIIYLIIRIKDVKEKPESETDDEIPEKCEEEDQRTSCQKQTRKMVKTVKRMLRKRPRNARVHLLHILPIMIPFIFAAMPIDVLLYLYVVRQPLSWSQSTYGYLNGFTHSLGAISQLIILPLLKKKKCKEPLLLVAGYASAIVSQVILGFSTTTWMVFLSAVVGFLQHYVWTIYRSLLSLLIEPNETGMIFAVAGALQTISILAGIAMFSNIYPHTLTFWPGFSFVLGAAIYIVPMAQIIWIHFDFKKQGTYAYLKEKAAEAKYKKVNSKPKENALLEENGHSNQNKVNQAEFVSDSAL